MCTTLLHITAVVRPRTSFRFVLARYNNKRGTALCVPPAVPTRAPRGSGQARRPLFGHKDSVSFLLGARPRRSGNTTVPSVSLTGNPLLDAYPSTRQPYALSTYFPSPPSSLPCHAFATPRLYDGFSDSV